VTTFQKIKAVVRKRAIDDMSLEVLQELIEDPTVSDVHKKAVEAYIRQVKAFRTCETAILKEKFPVEEDKIELSEGVSRAFMVVSTFGFIAMAIAMVWTLFLFCW
jgi:hypothetical protein